MSSSSDQDTSIITMWKRTFPSSQNNERESDKTAPPAPTKKSNDLEAESGLASITLHRMPSSFSSTFGRMGSTVSNKSKSGSTRKKDSASGKEPSRPASEPSAVGANPASRAWNSLVGEDTVSQALQNPMNAFKTFTDKTSANRDDSELLARKKSTLSDSKPKTSGTRNKDSTSGKEPRTASKSPVGVNPASKAWSSLVGEDRVSQSLPNPVNAFKRLTESATPDDSELPKIAPDATLEKMNVIISKRLKGVSVPDFYDIVFSEGNGTRKKPLYGPWLEERGSMDINVGDWDGRGNCQGGWCGEHYAQKRTVRFVVNKNIPFRSGPTRTKVKQTQYRRLEGNDKLVVQTTGELGGFPYSDCFLVEIRWTATRVERNDIAVKVGLFVHFIKPTVMTAKIRTAVTEKMTKAQLSLLEKASQVCGASVEDVVEKQEGIESRRAPLRFLQFWRRRIRAKRDDDIIFSIQSADKKLKRVIAKLEASEPGPNDALIRDQLETVNDALDKILSTDV